MSKMSSMFSEKKSNESCFLGRLMAHPNYAYKEGLEVALQKLESSSDRSFLFTRNQLLNFKLFFKTNSGEIYDFNFGVDLDGSKIQYLNTVTVKGKTENLSIEVILSSKKYYKDYFDSIELMIETVFNLEIKAARKTIT